MPNLNFATLAILELLAFNAQKIKGHMTLTTAPYSQIFFRGHVGTLVPDVRSKFHQNRLKIATVRARARTHKSMSDTRHRTSDTRHADIHSIGQTINAAQYV